MKTIDAKVACILTDDQSLLGGYVKGDGYQTMYISFYYAPWDGVFIDENGESINVLDFIPPWVVKAMMFRKQTVKVYNFVMDVIYELIYPFDNDDE